MRPLQAHCHRTLTRLELRLGRRDDAQEHLAKAIRLYTSLQMGFWLPAVESDLMAITEGAIRTDQADLPSFSQTT
jgi:hypothetical protein